MPATAVHRVLATELGPGWRALFREFNDLPAAAASIGQVHRAVWTDGTPVAVKVQYPGAGPALMSDLNQLGRLARIFGAVVPGLDVKPLIAELKVRVAEELDYLLEAESQRAFATAYDGDPDICVPQALEHGAGVAVQRQPGQPTDRVRYAVRQPVHGAEVDDAQPAVGKQPEVPRMRVRVQQPNPARTGVEEPDQQQTGPVAVLRRAVPDNL